MKIINAKIYIIHCLVLIQIIFLSCDKKHSETPKEITDKTTESVDQSLDSYWYQGKAEISSYDLEQVRYGQKHMGDAVLIFVTEDFSKSKQVKLDNPSQSGTDKITVLKMNYSKKFNTGIYPYSMFVSSFTPIGIDVAAHPIKISASIQEWCGHVFMQMNQREYKYEIEQFSYFETEGDQKLILPIDWCEDELFNQIRINPAKLPIDRFKIIPGAFFTRLKHKALSATDAVGRLQDINTYTQAYQIEFPLLQRNLKILFNKNAPYEILSWEESYLEGTEQMVSKATLKKRVQLDYWNKHNVEDSIYRKELELKY
ncbi:MAG: hypothetical protein IPO85_16055 [Saprospiraceae bacterium]|uniref:Septum formation inhibitor Maf n=1 Tax=Candidatus Defluviibacterium haderslevense TaxID=2981993 RepID=A0A9D7XIQ0_9BACT|nr:hypothetical protein [Candidatus Defluviibacterium haderslevense]